MNPECTTSSQVCGHPVNCEWGEWGSFGTCSKACGGGQQTRFRHVKIMPKHGGYACEQHAAAETRACNAQACGSLAFCKWTDWSNWSSCSADCGIGQQWRSRSMMITSEKVKNEADILTTNMMDDVLDLAR